VSRIRHFTPSPRQAPERYPLAWPVGRPRTKRSDQRRGTFEQNGKKNPTPGDAVE
jgi:hypothetical protein